VAEIAAALVNCTSTATADLFMLSTVAALSLITLAGFARAFVTFKLTGMVTTVQSLATHFGAGTLLYLGTTFGLILSLPTEAAVGSTGPRATGAGSRVAPDLARVRAAVATSPAALLSTAVRQHVGIKFGVAELATEAACLGRRVHRVLAAGAAPVLLRLPGPFLDAMDVKHSVALGAVVDGLLALDDVVADHALILIRINLRDKLGSKSAVALNVGSSRTNLLLCWLLRRNGYGGGLGFARDIHITLRIKTSLGNCLGRVGFGISCAGAFGIPFTGTSFPGGRGWVLVR
jgi:hypothetical protein